jgi:hypothetical protein
MEAKAFYLVSYTVEGHVLRNKIMYLRTSLIIFIRLCLAASLLWFVCEDVLS